MTLWQLASLNSRLVEASAFQGTHFYADVISELRTAYSSEVVERVEKHGIEICHDYQDKEKAIPLPATFTMRLGERLAQDENGMQVRLYSDHPFPWRENGGPRDEFEKAALRHLRANPTEPYVRLDEANGLPVMRYAVADRMRASCVHCHNTHPRSPKTGWKEGDVRGVLAVTRPLAPVIAQARADFRGMFLWITFLSVTGRCGLALVILRSRSAQDAAEAANRLLKSEIENHKKTEQTLVTSEERFRQLAETINEIFYVYDAAHEKILYVSPAFERIWGRSCAELYADAHVWLNDVHPDDRARVRAWFAGIAAADSRQEFRFVRADGATRWLDVRGFAVRHGAEATGRVVGIAKDITEHKHADDRLRLQLRDAALQAEVGHIISTTTDLRATLQQTAEAIVNHLGAAFARIWTLNEAEQMLELDASAGMYTHIDGGHARVPVGKFKIGLIAQEKQPHLTNQVVGDPRVGDQDWARREGMVAFAGYPLLVEGRVVGVLALFARHELGGGTTERLGYLATGVAQAIRRQRLIESLTEARTAPNPPPAPRANFSPP